MAVFIMFAEKIQIQLVLGLNRFDAAKTPTTIFHGTPEYANLSIRLGFFIGAELFPHVDIGWERFMRRKLEGLAVFEKFAG